MTNDTTTELANFDENLQANTRHLDDLFTMLEQIQQTLPTSVSQMSQGLQQLGTAQPQLMPQPLQLS